MLFPIKAAKARSLRDRRTVNVGELEEATSHLKTRLRIIDPRIELPKRQNLSHSETMELIHARRYQGSKLTDCKFTLELGLLIVKYK